MSAAEQMKTFNTIVGDLLKQLEPIIGSSYYFYFNKLIKINSSLPIQQFLYYALPLEEKILNRDESYFSNPDNHRDQLEGYDEGLQEILRLKGIWEKLDAPSKEGLWDITQALLYTGLEYVKIKQKK